MSLITPRLIFSCFCMLVGDMLFGYDTASFGGILANPGFIRNFGQYDAAAGTWAISSNHTSLLSSLAFIGKFLGCFLAGPLIERFGHRILFYVLSGVSVAGIILEISVTSSASEAGSLAQFILGRVIVYISVGLVEVAITTYQAEIVPAQFRGLVVVSLQLFLNIGSLLATGVNKAFSTTTDSSGWRAVTGIQFAFPILITTFTIFLPDSPRWLLSKDRAEDALVSLRSLRPEAFAREGRCEMEIEAIRAALQENVHKGPFIALLRGSNVRRTVIVLVYYFFQQTTGQAFISTYQTVFYKNNGYADKAFTYPIINGVLQMLSVIPAMYLVDKFGGTLSVSYFFQAFWILMLAGLGGMSSKSGSEKDMIVASFMLFAFSYNMGSASIPYLLGSEIPNASLREKTQGVGTAWNVLWAFATNYSLPFMLDELTFGVGYIFGGISLLALVFTFLFLPETKNLSLEELDAVFERPYNPFRPQKALFTEAELQVRYAEGDEEALSIDGKKKVEDTQREFVQGT